jgi:hypothetical protein
MNAEGGKDDFPSFILCVVCLFGAAVIGVSLRRNRQRPGAAHSYIMHRTSVARDTRVLIPGAVLMLSVKATTAKQATARICSHMPGTQRQ